MDDLTTLTAFNERFIDAFRKGSWEMLRPILSPGFACRSEFAGEYGQGGRDAEGSAEVD